MQEVCVTNTIRPYKVQRLLSNIHVANEYLSPLSPCKTVFIELHSICIFKFQASYN
jgi:hypothetical protein